MSNTVKTPKGTELALMNLKGKPYMQVAQRMIWFNEEAKNFDINTEFLSLTDIMTVAKATVVVKNEAGEVIKRATATKRETKADFADHTEKAETGAIGRALALMGFGTQFALADLDEGERIVDSPVPDLRKVAATKVTAAAPLPKVEAQINTTGQKGTLTNPTPKIVESLTPKQAAPTQPAVAAVQKISSFRTDKPATATPVAQTKTAPSKGGW